jgi:cellulose synthase/poly-beta-1,6-N-acetylglucosamine synthase-like glycosyltransferase
VTRQSYLASLRSIVDFADFDTSTVRVLAAPDDLPGFRGQLSHALKQAKGEIIAKVDGRIEWRDDYLVHMLPCFEDSTIGGAGGNLLVTISKDRQHPDNVTPWKVAAAKTAWNGRAVASMYARTKFRWILPGGSVL